MFLEPLEKISSFGNRRRRMAPVFKIVLIRHGESQWTLENRFCGWHDADLSPKGHEEAKQAGKVNFNLKFIFRYLD